MNPTESIASSQVSWCDSPADESMLNRLGASYETQFITVSEIDASTSLINGARWKAKVPDAIERYALAMRRGDTFPRLIVIRKPAGYVVLNGNQRFSAVQMLINDGYFEHDVPVGVYVVAPDTDSMTEECILKSANAVNGVPSSYEERMAHAIALVRNNGVKLKEAAELHLVSSSALSATIAADDEREFLKRNGISTETLPRSTLAAIGRLGPDESSKIKIAKLAINRGLKTDDVRAAVSKALDAKSISDRQSVIKAIEFDAQKQAEALQPSPAASLSPKRHRRDKFIRALDSIVSFLEAGNNGAPMSTVDDLQINGKADLARAKELSIRLISRLAKLGICQQ